MHSNQYLVTIYHRKSHKMAQRLIRGSIADAAGLVDALSSCCFGDSLKHLASTVVEIGDASVGIYIRPEKKSGEIERNLDEDIYVCQIFHRENPRFVCTSDRGYYERAMSGVRLGNKSRDAHCAVNRINFRGIYRLDGDEETRLSYTGYPDCPRSEFVNETAVVTI